MLLTKKDATMEEVDIDSDLVSDIEGEPRAKTPRREEAHTVTSSAAMPTEEDADLAWTQVLGPAARRAQRGGKLAAKTQDVEKRLRTQSAPGQAIGKGKPKGRGKGPGKGVVVGATSGASEVPQAGGKDKPSRWGQGAPPLVPGARFPPAGGIAPGAMQSP